MPVAEVTPVGKFYTISKDVFDPAVDVKTWRLAMKGLVARPYTLTYTELKALPTVEQYATPECISNEVGGNLISNALWKGVPLTIIILVSLKVLRSGIRPHSLLLDGGELESPRRSGIQSESLRGSGVTHGG